MKVIFAGTPEFSIPSLKYINENYELLSVITQPDRPKGRGQKVLPTPVKEYALKNNIPLFQPVDLKDKNFLDSINKFNADILLEVSYGRIFPNVFLEIMKNRCINFHPSLLPGYKGPNPIRWVIFNREKITGVSAHIISTKIDSGEILVQKQFQLTSTETYDFLYNKLSDLTVDIIDSAVENFLNSIYLKIEDVYEKKDFYAGKMDKQEYSINWNLSAEEINAVIRALNPKPGANTIYKNRLLKIYSVEILDTMFNNNLKPGEVIAADIKKGLLVNTGNGVLKIEYLKLENKKKLYYKDFINGIDIKQGDVLI